MMQLDEMLCLGGSPWWALLPRGCLPRSMGSFVLSVGNKHYGRLIYSCVMVEAVI